MIHVYRCGYESRHKVPTDIKRTLKEDEYLLLLVKSEAFFYVNGQKKHTSPNMMILFDKGTSYHYGSIQDYYNDDWIHFDFDTTEEDLVKKLKLPLNTPFYPSDYTTLSSLMRLVVLERHGNDEYKEKNVDFFMNILLNKCSIQAQAVSKAQNHKYYAALQSLRTEIHSAPHRKWSVSEMSAQLHISESYLQHLYKELYGLSCIQDVIKCRLEMAKYYLQSTDMSVQALSLFCGYENELHFMRQFKKFEGMTPSQYRTHIREQLEQTDL